MGWRHQTGVAKPTDVRQQLKPYHSHLTRIVTVITFQATWRPISDCSISTCKQALEGEKTRKARDTCATYK